MEATHSALWREVIFQTGGHKVGAKARWRKQNAMASTLAAREDFGTCLDDTYGDRAGSWGTQNSGGGTCRGNPWELKPSQRVHGPGPVFDENRARMAAIPLVEPQFPKQRQFYVLRSDVERFEGTAECEGGVALVAGVPPMPHSVECRNKVMGALERSGGPGGACLETFKRKCDKEVVEPNDDEEDAEVEPLVEEPIVTTHESRPVEESSGCFKSLGSCESSGC